MTGKRIIFVLGNLELGGAERQALILARHLSQQDQATVEVWGFNKSGPVAEICEQYGIRWRVEPLNANRLARIRRVAWLMADTTALSGIILKLAADPVLCAQLGAINKKRISENYDAHRMCQEIVMNFS